MMKRLPLLILLVSCGLIAVAQRSIFFEVSGKAIKTSYVLATLPTTDERTFNLSDSVFWAFDKAEVLATTSLVDSFELIQLEAQTKLPPKNEVFDFTNNRYFGKLDELTEELKGKPIWPYQRWSPIYLRDHFEQWTLDKQEGQTVENFFRKFASTQEKPVTSPLNLEDWSGMINDVPVLLQSDMLVHYLRLRENDNYRKRLINQFLQGDLGTLRRIERYYRHSEQFYSYWDPLSDKLSERMMEQSKLRSTFYLVDASMLGGEEGLLNLLAEKNLKVRPMGSGFNYKENENGTIQGLVTFSDTMVFEPHSTIRYYELNTEFQEAYFNDVVPGWYKLTSYRGGFSVRMPGPPEIIKEKLPAEAGGMNMYLYRYEDSKERNLYLVSFFDYPRGAEVKGSNEFFQQVIARTVQRFNGLLLKEQDISTDQFKGREIEMQGQENMIIRVRFYLVGHRLYQVVLSAEDKKAFSKANQAFFNSFKILDVYNRPWFRVNTAVTDISFPDEVNHSIERLRFEDTVTTTLNYSLTSAQTNLQYSATITFVPYRYKLDDDIDAYHRMAYESIDQLNGVLVDEGYSETSDYRAFYLEAGGEEEQMIRSRVIINRQTIIQLMVFGPEDSARSAFADRFLNSYRLHPDYR